MKAIGMQGRAACRLPQDLAGPLITIFEAWLHHAAPASSELLPLCGVKETEAAFFESNLVFQNNQQGRSPPGGAVCV